jgi:hypothetical protein
VRYARRAGSGNPLSDKSTQEQIIQTVYGALVGGLTSSFLAVSVLTVFMDSMGGAETPAAASLIGLGSAVVLLAVGLKLAGGIPWLGTSLLFGSGFTALWSVVLSFSVEPRWVMLVALAVAIVIAGLLGARRFGRSSAGAGSDTHGGMLEPRGITDLPEPTAPPAAPSPEVAPPVHVPEIVLPPGIHPVGGGDIRD